jgi:hypothetical protein
LLFLISLQMTKGVEIITLHPLLLIILIMLTNFVYDIQKKLAIISMNLNKLVLLPQEIDDLVW